MKRLLSTGIALLLFSAGAASAATEIERTMATELLTLTNAEASLATMREQMLKGIEGQLAAMDVPEKMKAGLVDHQKKMIALVFDELSWNKLKDQYVEVYVSVFTQEELAGLITFYRSPIGQTLIRKTPDLMKGMMEVATSRTQALLPQIQSMTEELLREAAKDAADDHARDPE